MKVKKNIVIHRFVITMLISVLFLINTTKNFAQKAYKTGYVITNNNDTIYGKIKDRKNGVFTKLYKRIKFKPNKGFRKRLSPNSVKVYNCGKQKFITMEIIDETFFFKRKVTSIPYSNNKQFVKVISEGYLSWLQKEYVDDSGLSTVSYFKKFDEDEMVFIRSGIFGLNKKELARYFYDCPKLAEKILNKSIKTPTEIIHFYNNWYSKKNNK